MHLILMTNDKMTYYVIEAGKRIHLVLI